MAVLTEKIATWEELASAPARGLEVLSHTRTHKYLDELGEAQLRDELDGSQQDLESRGFGRSNSLAWPYGKYSKQAMEVARDAGYEGAFLAGYHRELRDFTDPWRIHRVGGFFVTRLCASYKPTPRRPCEAPGGRRHPDSVPAALGGRAELQSG